MKKIMFIGADEKSKELIQYANRKGYLAFGCSYKECNSISNILNKYFCVDASNVDKIVTIIQEEKIDGVLSYSSDFLAVIQAKVAVKTGLIGNSVESCQIHANKTLFRKCLRENGFNDPFVLSIYKDEDIGKKIKNITNFPVMVKPTDCAGSRGVTKIDKSSDLAKAINFAFLYSNSGEVIIERFIENKYEYVIAGDVFVNDGKVVLNGVCSERRNNKINPFLPIGTFFPPKLTKDELTKVLGEIQRLVEVSGFKNGGMNVEMMFDINDDLYFIELAPRNGGNIIPDQIAYTLGINIKELLVETLLGEKMEYINPKYMKFTSTYILHAYKDGLFNGIVLNDKIKNKVVKVEMYKNIGEYVEYFENATKAIGILLFEFSCQSELDDFLINQDDYIEVIVI